MATEKTLKTRVVLKHDTEANWITAGNATNPFIPKKGEVIIYDPDGTHTYSRQKVGDGIKNINTLPFLGATVGTADSSESLFKIQYTAESAIPETPEQGVEYAITDAIGYGDLDSELQAKVDAGANAGSNLNTKASVDYVNKTHYGYSGDDLLIIPEGTTTIGDNAYRGKYYKCVVIPNSVTSIGKYAFDHCRFLTNITIPDSVTSIGYGAFGDCWAATSITIGNGVTSIGDYAFSSCSHPTSITIPDSVTSIGNSAFSYCTGLKSITIPNSVTSIGGLAFSYCTGLKSITIGNGVTSIGNSAFISCPLTTIDLTAYTTQSFPTLGTNNFTAIASGCQIKVVKGRKDSLIATSGWSGYANYVVEVPTVETLDTTIEAVKNGYLPLSGGTVSGAMTISGGITTQKITTDTLSVTDASGKISVTGSQLNFGQNNGTVISTITGISDSIGTSSTVAVSQKCLTDNYVPIGLFTSFNMGTPGVGINGTLITLNGQGSIYYADNIDYTQHIKQIETSITIPLTSGDYTKLDYSMGGDYLLFDVNTDKLAQAFLPLSGGTLTGNLTIGSTAINKDLDVKGNIGCKNLSAEAIGVSGGYIYAANFHTENPNNGGEAVHIDYDGTITTSGSIVLNNDGGTLTGISNSKGTSSTIAASQKCLNDNYVAKSELPSNLLKYQIVTSTSQIGTDPNTAYLILE